MRYAALLLLLILLLVPPITAAPQIIESEFYDASTGSVPGLLGVAISSGTTAAVATDANHPGVIYLRDSTTAAGGYRFGCSGSQLIAGGEYYEVIFQSVGTRVTQHARLGWSDSTAGATLPTDGVFFNITRNTAGVTNFTGNTASNNARSQTRTAYSMAASTWYRGTITVNQTPDKVEYRLYDASNALLWADNTTANIPTGAGRDTSPCIIAAESTTDAAANILILDYARWEINRTISTRPTAAPTPTPTATGTTAPTPAPTIPNLPAPHIGTGIDWTQIAIAAIIAGFLALLWLGRR